MSTVFQLAQTKREMSIMLNRLFSIVIHFLVRQNGWPHVSRKLIEDKTMFDSMIEQVLSGIQHTRGNLRWTESSTAIITIAADPNNMEYPWRLSFMLRNHVQISLNLLTNTGNGYCTEGGVPVNETIITGCSTVGIVMDIECTQFLDPHKIIGESATVVRRNKR